MLPGQRESIAIHNNLGSEVRAPHPPLVDGQSLCATTLPPCPSLPGCSGPLFGAPYFTQWFNTQLLRNFVLTVFLLFNLLKLLGRDFKF